MKTSFASIVPTWLPEVKEHCPNATIILVGLQNDRRTMGPIATDMTSSVTAEVAIDDAKQLAEVIHATSYLECSAVTDEGVQDVFRSVSLSYPMTYLHLSDVVFRPLRHTRRQMWHLKNNILREG